MRVKCRYSGVEFTVSSFNHLYLKVSSTHPIMHCPAEILLKQTQDWANDELTDSELRLLFTALLKSTDLVEFRTFANPDIKTIKHNMDRLLMTVNWRLATGEAFPVPKFAVDTYTQDLTSIPAWLDAWNDAKVNWETKGISWSLAQKLALREEALMKLIRSPARKEDSYARQMAKYILELTQAPLYLHEEWTKIFLLKDNQDIWMQDAEIIDKLLEYMEINLNPATVIAHDAFARIRRIKKIADLGMVGGLGINDVPEIYNEKGLPVFKILTATQSNYQMPALGTEHISFENIEEHNLQVAIANAPKILPIPSAYNSRVEYLRALSAWRIKEEAQKKVDIKLAEKKVINEEIEDKDTWEDEILSDEYLLLPKITGEEND
jgi:hypothetical protein